MSNTFNQDASPSVEAHTETVKAAFVNVENFAKENADVLTAAGDAYKLRFADLQSKSLAVAKSNMEQAFAFTQNVFGLKDMSSFFPLQQDFFKAQTAQFQNQVKEINDMSMALAQETMKPLQDGFAKNMAIFSKATAA